MSQGDTNELITYSVAYVLLLAVTYELCFSYHIALLNRLIGMPPRFNFIGGLCISICFSLYQFGSFESLL